jgi:hypothetical protein
LKGATVGFIVVCAALAAYMLLAFVVRVPLYLAFALSTFGACITGLFAFSFRLAVQKGHDHDH